MCPKSDATNWERYMCTTTQPKAGNNPSPTVLLRGAKDGNAKQEGSDQQCSFPVHGMAWLTARCWRENDALSVVRLGSSLSGPRMDLLGQRIEVDLLLY